MQIDTMSLRKKRKVNKVNEQHFKRNTKIQNTVANQTWHESRNNGGLSGN